MTCKTDYNLNFFAICTGYMHLLCTTKLSNKVLFIYLCLLFNLRKGISNRGMLPKRRMFKMVE